MNPGSTATLAPPVLAAIVEGRCTDPFSVFGIHALDDTGGAGLVVRTFINWARTVSVVRDGGSVEMARLHPEGVFEARFPEEDEPFDYRLRITPHGADEVVLDDPYRLLPVLDEEALMRFRRGDDTRIHRQLGARPWVHQGLEGTRFSVFAPHAENVNLLADFNRWDGRCHPMRPRGSTGVWELFLPGVGPGALYKYDVRPGHGRAPLEKADPCAFASELRPLSASVVWDPERYAWSDDDWMRQRPSHQGQDRPLSIYEVHLGSWRRHPGADPKSGYPGWLTYEELADSLFPHVLQLGYTHIELLPVTEHPLDESWGYQTTGYFSPTSRFGSPDDFKAFIDRAHRLGLGVILDWVPAHFPVDEHGLIAFDGSALYEHPDPRQGTHPDWGTLVFDYGRPEVTAFLVSSALFWLEEYHIDGLRVDAVASMLYLDYSREDGDWLPNAFGGNENLEAIAFLRHLNDVVHQSCPGTLMIAEESTAWPKVTRPPKEGGLGFDLKWNMGWMNDTLEVFSADPLFRKGLYNKLTFSMLYAFSERFLLPISHDEVVHLKRSLLAKMPGTDEERFANTRLLFGYMWGHPGKKLLFMGSELGERTEWDATGELDWAAVEDPRVRGLGDLIGRLNRLGSAEPALFEIDDGWEGFEWLDCHDPDRTVISFIRWGRTRTHPVVVVCNFTPVPWEGYRLPVPHPGTYEVLVNTDAAEFAGSGQGPSDRVTAVGDAYQSRPAYLEFTLPPLAALFLRLAPNAPPPA